MPPEQKSPKRPNPHNWGLFSDPWKFHKLPAPSIRHSGRKTPATGGGRKTSVLKRNLPKGLCVELNRSWVEVFRAKSYSRAVWSAFRSCAAVLIDGHAVFNPRFSHHRDAWAALRNISLKIALRALHRGPDECSTWIKDGVSSCRRRVVTGEKIRNEWTDLARKLAKWSKRPVLHALVQLSYIGRALPAPSISKNYNAALMEHYNLLTSEDACPQETLDSIKKFAKKWAKSKLKDLDASWDIQVTGGAAIGFPKAQGGHQMNISGAVWEAFADAECPPWVEPDVWQTLAGLGNVRLALCNRLQEKFPNFEGIPPGEVLPLPEPGNKLRIVSKGDSDFVTIVHSLRDLMFQMLRKDPTISTSLRGDDVKAVSDMWEEAVRKGRVIPGSVIVSSDMTVATDGIYQSCYLAAWEGIAEATEMSDEAVKLGRMALGPQKLKWTLLDNRFQPRETLEKVTTRGALMGNPLPWSLLCVLHRWAAEMGISETLGGKPGFLFRKAPYRIFGDDAIAVWPRKTERKYAHYLNAIGAKLSKNKHFISSDLTTPQFGFFCEKGYIFDQREILPIRTKTYPLKGLVHAGGAVQEAGRPKDRGLPGWATVGPTLSSLLLYDPTGFRGLRWASRYIHPGLSKWYMSKGILPYLPREFGGGGLIPRKGSETKISEVAPARYRKVLADMYCSEEPGVDWEVFGRLWKLNYVGRHQQLSVEFTDGVFEKGAYCVFKEGAVLPNGYEDVQLTRREVEDKLNHWWRKGFLLLMGPDPQRGWKLRPSRVSKGLWKYITNYKSASWAQPAKNLTTGDFKDRKEWHNRITRCARRVTDVQGKPLDTEPRDYDEVRQEVLTELYEGQEPESWSHQILLEEEVEDRRQPDLSTWSDSLIKGRRAGSALTRQREIALALGWEAFLFKRELRQG